MQPSLSQPPTPDEVAEWCREHLNAEPVDVLFEAQHLSYVTGLRLSDGREVVVKARPASPRIAAGVRLQAYMWQEGFPAPQPLTRPRPLGALTGTAEVFVAGGSELYNGPEYSRLFAEGLARFVQMAAGFVGPLELGLPLPWLGWEHEEPGLWPPPDDLDVDLNAIAGYEWLDDIGRRVRARLLRDDGPKVIGHGDWWRPNLHWLGDELQAVVRLGQHIVYLPEAAITGSAAAEFRDEWPRVTTIEQTADFLDCYERARGRPWSADEREVCWAAGLWQLTFNARKQSLQGVMETVEHLRRFGEEKLRLAGA